MSIGSGPAYIKDVQWVLKEMYIKRTTGDQSGVSPVILQAFDWSRVTLVLAR
jgi:hypothetical protein